MWTPSQSSLFLLLLLFVFSFLLPGAEAEARRGGGRRRDREGKLREFVTYYTLLRKLNIFFGIFYNNYLFLFGQSPSSRSFGKTIALIKNMPSLPLFEETNYFFCPPLIQNCTWGYFSRFPNDICPGTSGMNGTCYTQEECSDRGGTNGGACASGFGVCCLSK